MARPRRNPDLKAWLAERCVPEPNSGCWLWMRWCDRDGYGKPGRSGRCTERLAHRISFEIHHGPIPAGVSVLHRCDTPSCVNPDHLFLGDQLANMTDMVEKGRRASFKGSRHGMAKLVESDVVAMREAARAGAKSPALSQRFGVSARHIRSILRRELWQHV